ncbi:unnamed protein product [Rotaria sordida]|uniref:FAD-binding FR-type domain-containing protein n=1 Tax=Rotaria sordida TaxID=392033 RepID=A0A819DQ84_9BILA|nr:unnamed protein product [Rotaria sordida]
MESPQQQHRLCTHTQSSNELDRAEHHLNELLNEPLCDHDFRTFTKHFDGDISKKNFTIEEFYKLFQLTKTFGERLLGILNESRCIEAKSISGENIIRIARILSMAPRLVKALILFKIFDHDDNKMITIQEISEFYEIYLVEFRFPHNELHRQELINTFLQNFRMINDNDNLNFDQFYSILQETPELFESLQLMNIPINDNDIKKLEWQAWRINNRYQILIGLLYILGTIGIIINVIIKLIIHEQERKGYSFVQCMFTTSRQQGWVSGLTPITGNILLVFLIIMIIGALQCIRQREKCFILFRISHLLFWPIFILLVIHSEEFWKWACGPMFLFICEKLYLLKRYLPQKGRTHLKKVTIEDDNTISFTIVRPPYFNFNTGDYVNICFPRIVSYEWHPFTLSSCPENKDTLRIHISKRKNWTRKIYEHFNQQWKCQNEHFDVVTISTASITNNNIHSPSVNYPYTFNSNESIWIEGPYSSSTSYTFDCEHVVLIGAGIGITPYAGVLESLMYQFREQQNKCQHCHCINYDHEAIARRKLKKVDFIWVNRDVKNFSWFLQLLTDFENEQLTYLQTSTSENTVQQRYIDFHLYFTSLKRNDQGMIGNAPYDLVSNIYAKISNRDILTKLKTKTIVGRPQWPLLFAKLKAEYEKTNVFFTGSHSMGDEIRRLCDQYKFMYHHEPYF